MSRNAEQMTCRMCGRSGTRGFKQSTGVVAGWVCKSARACMGRAKIGGYR